MNKILIVAGVPGAGKSSVLNEVHKRRSESFQIESFGTVMLNFCLEQGLVDDRDKMRNLPHETQKELQIKTSKIIAEKAEKEKNILLDTHCAIKTPAGYISGLTDQMLDILKPSAIILVDAHEVEIRGRRKQDKNRPERTIESFDDIHEHKVINRAFATSFAQKCDATLKIVQNNTGEFETTVDQIVTALDFITDRK